MLKKLFAGLVFLICCGSVFAQSLEIVEDGESGNTDKWKVFDTSPAGYAVNNRSEGQNRFITFTSRGTRNGYMLGNTSADAPGLNLTDARMFSFRVRAAAGFNVAVVAQTDKGVRYLRYSRSINTVPRGNNRVVSIGLGRESYNRYWQSFTRDLQADLDIAQPGNNILAINGVQVRGSADIDDLVFFDASSDNIPPVASAGADQQIAFGQSISLDGTQSSDADGEVVQWRWTDDKNTVLGNSAQLDLPAKVAGKSAISLTVTDDMGAINSQSIVVDVLPPAGLHTIAEDGEQADTGNWLVHDTKPSGYSIDNVLEDNNRFIRLQGTDRKNAFGLGHRTASTAGLGIENQFNVSWRMRSDNPFTVYFAVDTTAGFRYLEYTHNALSEPAGATRNVRTGLGSLAYDGSWHLFDRDLQADLAQAQPENSILSVNGVFFRGSVDVDDLIFYASDDGSEPLPDTPLSPELLTPLTDANLLAGSTAAFSWRPDGQAERYNFELALLSDEFSAPLLSSAVLAQDCAENDCVLEMQLPDELQGTYAWRVAAENAGGQSDWSVSSFDVVIPSRPAVPVNVSPAVGANVQEGAELTFFWLSDPSVESYDFHLFDRVNSKAVDFVYDLQPDEVCSADQCRFTREITLPAGDNHAWRIRAANSAGKSNWSRNVFNVVSGLPAPPRLELPTAQATLEAGTTSAFVWQKSATASTYALHIFAGSEPETNLIKALVKQSACSANTCSLSINLDLPAANDYLWQVTASNSSGDSVSAQRGFALGKTIDPVPGRLSTPVNVSPDAASDLVQGADVEFMWQRDSLAVSYEFHIFDNVNKETTPYVTGLLADDICVDGLCSLTYAVTQPVAKNHAWRVRALNAQGYSEWSRTVFSVVESTNDPDSGNTPPEAEFTFVDSGQSASGTAPFTVSADPSGSTDDESIVSYSWTFGDGSPLVEVDEAAPVAHTYTEAGNYTVELVVSDAQGLTARATRRVTVSDSTVVASAVDAARLLTQASFGPTLADVRQVQRVGVDNWLETQFTLTGPSHFDYVQQYSNGSGRSPRHEIWWKSAIDGEDQLRQRVAFALSQLFVVSDTGYTLANAQYGVSSYYQMLLDNAFGNYRELLEKVTLHPVMGIYLSMLQNGKGNVEASTRADENYAREVLQLFSIGLHNLDPDGTTDGSPVFTQDQIEAFARVFTGWNYADAGRWDRPLFTNADMINPMEPFEQYHDTSEKVLLNGEVSPAGLSAREDLELALNNIFNHPNVGPFVVKQLIKRLVTSNPSRQYVGDITAVFNDDGSGTRGNLKAVVKALLLHEEARSIPDPNTYGKLREPALRLSHLWRAFGVQPGSQNSSERNEYNTGSPQLSNLELDTGQAPLKSASVFNFFQTDFAPAGMIANSNLKAPEFELFTESNELATSNRIGQQIQRYSVGSSADAEFPVSYLDFAFEVLLAEDSNALLDHLNIVLLAGNMSSDLRNLLVDHLQAMPDSPPDYLARVRDVVTLIMASPDYLVQM